jgi:multidrug resistance efflux pump
MIMKRFAMPLIAAISLTFAMAWTLGSRAVNRRTLPPSQPPVDIYEHSVAAVGLVEPESENINLSCAVSGLVTAVYVKAGDSVQSGQKLFSLDDRDLRADLQVKRTALESARAQLVKLQQEPRAEEVPPSEARVRAADADLADAEVQMRLIERVTDRRAVREEDVQRRRIGYQGAQARLAEAEKNLDLLKAGAWAPDIAVAKATVDQAEAQVQADETNIERLTMRAPMDGVILQNNVRLGQYATCGQLSQPLMIFGGGRYLHIRAEVDETDASRTRPDTPAVAYARGDTARKYALEFVRFEPYVVPKTSLTGETTERVDTRVLQAIYRVVDAKVPLYVGQQMDIYIAAPSAVRVEPNGATRGGGK